MESTLTIQEPQIEAGKVQCEGDDSNPPCGYHITLKCENPECKDIHQVAIGCGHRFTCPDCRARWKRGIIGRYREPLARFKNPKLMTLTLRKQKGERINSRIAELSGMVKYLRKVLARRGYPIERHMWVIELPNHVHGVFDGAFIPQSELAEIWKTITGDSMIVDIRKCDTHRTVHYLVKYIAKMSTSLDTPQGAESGTDAYYEHLLAGVHLVGSWNTLNAPKTRLDCARCGRERAYFILDVEKKVDVGLYSSDFWDN
jgi:hypothetical protein